MKTDDRGGVLKGGDIITSHVHANKEQTWRYLIPTPFAINNKSKCEVDLYCIVREIIFI